MTTAEFTLDQLTADIISSLDAGGTPPWRDRDALSLGLMLSGSTKKLYGGVSPFLLWEAARRGKYTRNLWFTEAAAIRKRGTVKPTGRAVVVRGHRVFNIDDILDLDSPAGGFPSAAVARRRVLRLVRFVQANLAQGEIASFKSHKDLITLPPAANFKNPDDYCVSALTALVHWTGGNSRLKRTAAGMPIEHPNFALEALGTELAVSMLCAWLGLQGTQQQQAEYQAVWLPKLKTNDRFLADAAAIAHRAFDYVRDLSPADLLTDKKPVKRRGRATALGEVLEIPFDEVGKGGEWEDEQLMLTLPETPANAMRSFLKDFAGTSKRRRPPPYAFITGGSGSGRTQVITALGELLLTGGTDLEGSLLQGENDDGALLDSITAVWEIDELHVVPCELPKPGSVAADRALSTACLGAFHISRGLSPVMWMARLEHVLQRSDAYTEFTETFQAFAGRRWRGGANRDPDEAINEVIEALGGEADDPEDEDTKRVHHYKKTRATATFKALKEEVDESIFRAAQELSDRTGRPIPEDPPPRVLFVVDVAPILGRHKDKDDQKWVRKCLREIRDEMATLASGGESSIWFLLCCSVPMRDLWGLGDWSDVERKIVKTHVALERHPVTGAFKQRLLAKIPAECAPLYRMFADHKDELIKLAKLEGWPAPVKGDRDDIVDSFPFLPSVLPVAQAVLDTMSGDGDTAMMPLSDLVEKSIDEHYYGPLDRFIGLDELFEPLMERIEKEEEEEQDTPQGRQAPSAAAARPAAAMVIIMPTAAVATKAAAGGKPRLGGMGQTFKPESVLRCLRLVNRIDEFPCTPANLVRLMFAKLGEDYEVMLEEVTETLYDLQDREFVKTEDDETWTYIKMR